MILPTREQMHRLAPSYAWQEPAYKSEQWKYDPSIMVPWDHITLNRAKRSLSLKQKEGISIVDNEPDAINKGSNDIATLVNALCEVDITIYIRSHTTITLLLSDILGDHAITRVRIVVEPGATVVCHDDRARRDIISASSFEIEIGHGASFHFSDRETLPDYTHEFRSFIMYGQADSYGSFFAMRHGIFYTKTFVTVYLQGSCAEGMIRCGAVARAHEYHSLITQLYHQAPSTISRTEIKYVQHDQARTMYDGHISIEQSGTKSQASQHHAALLLHEGARAYARPTLQAKTNDIQCGHGSAIGMLREEELWYLQSRGFDKQTSQKILIDAFLQDFFI